jgi:hypothetical protein
MGSRLEELRSNWVCLTEILKNINHTTLNIEQGILKPEGEGNVGVLLRAKN